MRRLITPAILGAALILTGCGSSDTPDDKPDALTQAADISSAQDIADALKDAGLTVSTPKEDTGDSYITDVGGTPHTFTVTDQDDPAPGNAYINLFPTPEALDAWVPLSKQFGGVAVTGDTWAVSLPTRDATALAHSKRLAPKVAEALDGTVQQ
ncbi:hypothetical protein IF129_10280 [Streptomyces chumphonensis]|uniref:Lipoprotein n=1 Tax=Streptomyces chumphonensis TaxID=1214925 RepID=A0A927F059_9ACTN|nr:hypothetical protein [Streptomyces chumphonensis]MBD3931942.1 hypothetical protein [Streptomyces chumphonensis]